MFANSEDRTHTGTACVSECFYSLRSAPRCASPASHECTIYTCRTHEACLVMLFYTHGLAPGFAPQVSHKRIWQYGRDLTHTRNLCQLAPGSAFKTNVK